MRRLVKRLRCEHGIALPAALAMLFIVGALAAVAATSAVSASDQSSRDRNVKRAIAAADAGVQVATYRLNELQPKNNKCVREVAGRVLDPKGKVRNGWCAPLREDLGDGERFEYWVSKGAERSHGSIQRWIVSRGTAGTVSRRAVVNVVGPTGSGQSLLGRFAVSSKNRNHPLKILGNSIVYEDPSTDRDGYTGADVRSNDDVLLTSTGLLCGEVWDPNGSANVQGGVWGGASCPLGSQGPFATNRTARFALQRVNQHRAPDPAVNDNDLIDKGYNDFVGGDPFVVSGSTWLSPERVLILRNGASLTLTGAVYSFCYLELRGNSELNIDGENRVDIYIDTPADCQAQNGDPPPGVTWGSVRVKDYAKIINEDYPDPRSFQIWVTGNQPLDTHVTLESNAGAPWSGTIYAPESFVRLAGASHVIGAAAGDQVEIDGSFELQYDDRAQRGSEGGKPLFRRQSWAECTPTAYPTDPASGC